MNDNNEFRDEDEQPEVEVSFVEIDPSKPLEEQISEDMPEQVKDAIAELIGNGGEKIEAMIEKKAQKAMDSAYSQLDHYADQLRQAMSDDEDGPAMSRNAALGTFTHHLIDHSEHGRSAMGVLLGVAIYRLKEYQDKVLDLEMELAGHASS